MNSPASRASSGAKKPNGGAFAAGAALRSNRIADEEENRAAVYAMLGRLMAAAPTGDLLEQIRGLQGDDSEFGRVIADLSRTAKKMSPKQIAEEFEALFVGLPQAQLMPYGSYYVTGSLFGRPLAKLRMSMAQLGIARSAKATEPEDHIASVCEMMAGLIMGRFGRMPATLKQQQDFFENHLAPWAEHFFSDLEANGDARFYRQLASVALLFMEMERHAFAMA